MPDPILNYRTPTPRYRAPIPQFQTGIAMLAPWLIVIFAFVWSGIAVTHFQNVDGERAFYRTDQLHRDRYDIWALNIPGIGGLSSFVALFVVYRFFILRRHRYWAWLLFLILILSGGIAFIVFVFGMLSFANTINPW